MDPTPPNDAIREAGGGRPAVGQDAIQAGPPTDCHTTAPQLTDEEVRQLIHDIVASEVPPAPGPSLFASGFRAGVIGACLAGLPGFLMAGQPWMVMINITQFAIVGFMLGAIWGCMRYWSRQGRT